MLKGHATIELTNVKTGEIEKYEESNLITNAASEYINSQLPMQADGASIINSWYLPLQSQSMGGIALFEKPIEENVNITYFPSDNPVLGFGGTKTDQGLDSRWGARNLAESEAYNSETKRIKYVWDFKTNQAIGTISCVGLIPGSQGNFYGDLLWNENLNRRSDITEFFTQEEAKNMIEFNGNHFISIINGTGKVNIKTYEIDFGTVGLNESIGHRNLLTDIEVAMPSSLNYDGCIWRSDDSYWYGMKIFYDNAFTNINYTPQSDPRHSYYNNTTRNLQIIRIDKNTYEMTYHNLNLSQYVFPRLGFIITNKYIFIPYSSDSNATSSDKFNRKSIIKISLEDYSYSIHNLVNKDGVAQSLKWNTNTSYQWHGIYGAGFNLIKMPNNTYMFNNLILDDDGYVLHNLPGPVNASDYIPKYNDEISYNGNCYVSTLPGLNLNVTLGGGYGYSYYGSNNTFYCTGTLNLILNKENSCLIWIGYYNNYYYHQPGNYGTQNVPNFAKVNVYAIPLYSQKLMTINNLETPIEKTSDKTMKITYVLTEVEDEE